MPTAKATAAEKAQAKLLREQTKAIKAAQKAQEKLQLQQVKAALKAQKDQEKLQLQQAKAAQKAHEQYLRQQAKLFRQQTTATTTLAPAPHRSDIRDIRDIPVLVPIQPRYVDSTDELNVLRSRVAALEVALATLMGPQGAAAYQGAP